MRLGGFAGERPFQIPHRGRRNQIQNTTNSPPTRGIFRDNRGTVGRSECLPRQIAQVQQRRVFQATAKFTYEGLSEVAGWGCGDHREAPAPSF